jgi:hypothetical protein
MADSTQSQNPSNFNSAEYQRGWRAKNRVKSNEYQRGWRAANRDKALAATRKYAAKSKGLRRSQRLKKRYGVTVEEYDAVLAKQDGVCAICCQPTTDGRRLAVDHCHYTGKFRGLLCFHCNTAVGKLGDTADKVARAVKYLTDGGT